MSADCGLPHPIQNGVTILRDAPEDRLPATAAALRARLDGRYLGTQYNVGYFYDPARGVPPLLASLREDPGFDCEDQARAPGLRSPRRFS